MLRYNTAHLLTIQAYGSPAWMNIAANPAVSCILSTPMHTRRVKIRIAQLVRHDLFSLPCSRHHLLTLNYYSLCKQLKTGIRYVYIITVL